MRASFILTLPPSMGYLRRRDVNRMHHDRSRHAQQPQRNTTSPSDPKPRFFEEYIAWLLSATTTANRAEILGYCDSKRAPGHRPATIGGAVFALVDLSMRLDRVLL